MADTLWASGSCWGEASIACSLSSPARTSTDLLTESISKFMSILRSWRTALPRWSASSTTTTGITPFWSWSWAMCFCRDANIAGLENSLGRPKASERCCRKPIGVRVVRQT